jgi:hypothetical protein
MTPIIASTNQIKHATSPSPNEIQHHIFALSDAAFAPAMSPAPSFPFT